MRAALIAAYAVAVTGWATMGLAVGTAATVAVFAACVAVGTIAAYLLDEVR